MKYRFRQSFIPFLFSGLGTGIFLCFLSATWNIPTFAMGFLIGSSVSAILFFTTDLIFIPVAKKVNLLVSVSLLSVYYILVIYFVSVFWILIFNLGDLSFMIGNIKLYLYNDYIFFGLVFGLIISFFINFYIALNTLLGNGVLVNMLIGRYHRPKIEKRFFLSIDIKSSTTIAENLGPHKFMMLLNDFFYDISRPVVLTGGEIYKYIGDEAIISWKEKQGKKNQNPVRCVFLFTEQIRNKYQAYQKKYSIVPEFRAAIHFGEVVTGEMGFIRKEITFLGDALNTNSRILDECKKTAQELLISETAWRKMESNDFSSTEIGPVLLRGKSKEMNLFTARPAQKSKK